MILKSERRPIAMAFERERITISTKYIQPLRLIGDAIKRTPKYGQFNPP